MCKIILACNLYENFPTGRGKIPLSATNRPPLPILHITPIFLFLQLNRNKMIVFFFVLFNVSLLLYCPAVPNYNIQPPRFSSVHKYKERIMHSYPFAFEGCCSI